MQSPSLVLAEKFWALKRSRVRVSPCHSVRASSIGHDCARFLFYEQTAWEMRVPPTVELQCLFDLGNEVEPIVFRELEAMGIQVLQRGKDYVDRRYNITGHVDGKLVVPGFDKPIPAEIKGLNPFTAGALNSIDDIRNHQAQWVRKYYGQLQQYLLLDNSELGVFVLFDKTAGQIKFIDCPLDYVYAESLLKKAETVTAAVKAGEAPDRHLSDECVRCPFVHVCKPDVEFNKGVELFDNTEVEAMLARREELDEARKEYDRVDKSIKKLLPEKEKLLVGNFILEGSQQERSGHTVKPFKFWQWKFTRIGAK